jgi:antitoxin component of RelBE/YafQ-DinJ toxin-antitoxin module
MVTLSPKKPRVKANLNLPPDVKQQAQALVLPLGVSLSQYVTMLVEADLAARAIAPAPEVRAA